MVSFFVKTLEFGISRSRVDAVIPELRRELKEKGGLERSGSRGVPDFDMPGLLRWGTLRGVDRVCLELSSVDEETGAYRLVASLSYRSIGYFHALIPLLAAAFFSAQLGLAKGFQMGAGLAVLVAVAWALWIRVELERADRWFRRILYPQEL